MIGLILYGVHSLDLDFHILLCLIVCTAIVMQAMVWRWIYVCFQYSPGVSMNSTSACIIILILSYCE